jgi:RimJ/RimL family protein N-acetyltransferase
MDEVTYRLAAQADFPLLCEYYTKLNAFFRTLSFRLPEVENVGQVWLASFERTLGRFSVVYVAEMDGEVVGFMLGRIKRVPPYLGGVLVGELSDMWIEGPARRLGVGDKLSRLTLDWLREQGTHSVEIQVLVGNEASWKLYERMGFQPEFRQARLTWDDYDRTAPQP